ncbi:MAG TPA: hypothetical protein VK077_11860, partial [Virgibacillus sp.]|nr:hypothetical protein [Virgibacillus sp.]
MSFVEKVGRTRAFNMFASLLLIFSLLTSAIPPKIAFADNTRSDYEEGHGSIKNDQGEIDYPEATINKEVSFGNKPGEYFIDLTVKGKSRAALESMDIAVAYDNSNSMKTNNRVGIAKTATDNFVNDLLSQENSQLSKGYQMALVTYGSAVFDGR